MKHLFKSNPSSDISKPISDTLIRFFVNSEGRLYQIIWGTGEPWGNEKQKKWDLEEANENDLKNAFECLALGNPADFKALYYTLKEHDDVTFPCIQETLQEIQETFNFN